MKTTIAFTVKTVIEHSNEQELSERKGDVAATLEGYGLSVNEIQLLHDAANNSHEFLEWWEEEREGLGLLVPCVEQARAAWDEAIKRCKADCAKMHEADHLRIADLESERDKYRQSLLDIDCALQDKGEDLIQQIETITGEALKDYYDSPPNGQLIVPPYEG